MNQAGEQELLTLIRAGNYAAFEEMHRRYYTMLFNIAANKTGDDDEAYDLLQEMFIELWEKRASFSISNPLPNYLKNRLWFKIAGHFREKGFRQKHINSFTEFVQQQGELAFAPEEDVQELNLQYEALMATIDRSIASMPAKMREIFLLSRKGDHTIAEIAAMLQLSPKTVQNQINNALNRLRDATRRPGLTISLLVTLICATKS